jgi:translation elongation factor EF-Tu-like GTPase
LKFLGLVGKLDWNKTTKVAALQQAILDKIKAQLIGRDLLKNLPKFAIIY